MSKSYLLSFAKTKGNMAAVAFAAILMAANATVASAQNKATEDNGIEGTVIGGVDDLWGVDPSETYCTTKHTDETDGDKIVCLYNVGAKKFLSVGGMWGTHASLDVTPYSIYMFWNVYSKTFCLESKVKGSVANPYMGIDTKHNQVFMDQKAGDRSIIIFDKAKDYSKNNKVYLVRIGYKTPLGYLTAYPDNENKLCDYQASKATEGTQEYKNQEWKVITKNEYYKLFNISPANMESAVDASFLIACPEFRANNADATKWLITGKGNDLPTDWKSHMRFGDEYMYKTHDKVESTGSDAWVKYNEDHQRVYGQYFYCYTKGLRGFTFYQNVKVHKAGWFMLRCNGFSTANSSEDITTNGKPLANLFITVLGADGKPNREIYSAASLNGISQADAEALAQTHNGKKYDGAGIGHAFFEGEYENQVQICLDKALDGNEITSDNPVTLRIGFYVDPTPEGKPDVAANELTAVDNFKLLYAGPRRRTELILDEDQTSLLYLTNAKDSYINSVLHLNRTLKEGQWNSLILPVKLNFGQMKRTFGDDVKVAKLTSLKDGVVIFRTVEPKQDSDVMVEAFEPYIIKPTSLTKKLGLPYTAEKFYTQDDENNAFWLSKNCMKESNDEKDRFSLTIPAGHYDILMVTLNRNELIKHLNLTEEDKTYYDDGKWQKIDWANVNWKSNTSFSTGAKEGDLTCYGTLTKTYKDNGNGKNVIIEGRDDLKGDYIMRDGKIMQVPSSKQYGLKGFRCWFEVKGGSSQAKPLRLEIDGTSDDATSIDEINCQPSQFTSRHKGISGVFNLDGQKVREGKSTQNLPKGIYIVNGRKVVVM